MGLNNKLGGTGREVIVIPDELLKLVLLGLGTAVGYLLKQYLDRRKEVEVARIADRRDHYRNLMLCLKSLSEGRHDNNALLRFEYSFLWLYAPDSVIRSFNRVLQRLESGDGAGPTEAEIGELVLAMRRDLGFERTRLLASEFQASSK